MITGRTSYRLDRNGNVWIPEVRGAIGQVRRDRHSRLNRRYVAFRTGEYMPVSVPGRNSVFASEESAAEALVGVVRSEIPPTLTDADVRAAETKVRITEQTIHAEECGCGEDPDVCEHVQHEAES